LKKPPEVRGASCFLIIIIIIIILVILALGAAAHLGIRPRGGLRTPFEAAWGR
jgi:flagellar basal body-associated protein FliL